MAAAAAAFKLMKSHCVLLLAYIACIVKRRRIKLFGGKKEIGLTWGLVQFVMFFSFLFRSFIICVLVEKLVRALNETRNADVSR